MTTYQRILLEIISDNGWDVFNTQMLLSDGRLTRFQINEALRFMLNNGEIRQLEKGKYRRQSYSDEQVIGCFLVPDGGIAYWTALNYHGLTEQFPNVVFIQNSSRKGDKKIKGMGVTYRFVKVKPEKITGYKTLGYGNHIYKITDIEKTLVDCFDLTRHSGGYPEIVKAFNMAKLNAQKMVRYCKAVDNTAATKRLAYLTELLQKPGMEYFLQYAGSIVNERYSPFDASLPHHGPGIRKWKLILNIPEEEILDMANPVRA